MGRAKDIKLEKKDGKISLVFTPEFNQFGKKVMKIMDTKEMASKGGRACYKKIGKKGMSLLGKKGAEVRWSNYRKKCNLKKK